MLTSENSTNTAPARQAVDVERLDALGWHTEDFRTRRAAAHSAVALESLTRAETLIDVGGVVDNPGDNGRASSRACPTCGAHSGEPCVGKRGRPIAKFHRERAGLRELAARKIWHERRAKGQGERLSNVRGCGSQIVAPRCSCGQRGKARPMGCGVWRLCPSCALREAIRRRARFGRARGRVILAALAERRAGAAARYRKGGRYTDKMVTLTVPHFSGEELFFAALDLDLSAAPEDRARATAIREILKGGSDTIHARVNAVFAAWPRFLRSLRAHLRARGMDDDRLTKFDRFFEWTPGADKEGHPHFHCWFFSPFLCAELVAELWTAALRAVGVPVRTRTVACEHGCGCDHVIGARAWVQRMGDFDEKAVREMIAGRKALDLSALGSVEEWRSFNVGPTARTYAAGWSMSDVTNDIDAETQARLYEALEQKRLSQGCKGLYSDDAPPACPCCGVMGKRVVQLWNADDIERTATWNQNQHNQRETGPP